MEHPAPSSSALASQTTELRALSGVSMMDCKKALVMHGGDFQAALRWLSEGHWRAGKLISWDQAALTANTARLQSATGRSASECREVLMNCAGNFEIAKARLSAANHG